MNIIYHNAPIKAALYFAVEKAKTWDFNIVNENLNQKIESICGSKPK